MITDEEIEGSVLGREVDGVADELEVCLARKD